jgi:hypothetical protein
VSISHESNAALAWLGVRRTADALAHLVKQGRPTKTRKDKHDDPNPIRFRICDVVMFEASQLDTIGMHLTA